MNSFTYVGWIHLLIVWRVCSPNPTVGVNCIGFDRRSELRFGFPAFAMPGHRIPEILATGITPETWKRVVRSICTMCGVGASVLDSETHKAGISSEVHINIMEALFTGALGLCGAYTGWDCEQVDGMYAGVCFPAEKKDAKDVSRGLVSL